MKITYASAELIIILLVIGGIEQNPEDMKIVRAMLKTASLLLQLLMQWKVLLEKDDWTGLDSSPAAESAMQSISQQQ